MSNIKHIITELGVLKNLSIGRRPSPQKLIEYKKRVSKITKTKTTADLLLEKIIAKDIKKNFNISDIPGIIRDEISLERQISEKKLIDLTYFASIISKKAIDKKLNKFELCYLINTMVNMMSLSEEDFNEFHKKFRDFESGNTDSPDVEE